MDEREFLGEAVIGKANTVFNNFIGSGVSSSRGLLTGGRKESQGADYGNYASGVEGCQPLMA